MEALERRASRIYMAIGIFLVVGIFCAVLFKLIMLQIVRKDFTPPNYIVKRDVLALRGRIFDRNHKTLAETLPGRIIAIDPQDPKLESKQVNQETLPLDIAKAVKVPVEDVLAAFHEPKDRFVKLRETADETIISEVERRRVASTNRFAGIAMREQEIRARPNGSLFCHVLGFVNFNGEGTYGVEQTYDKYLQGENGHLVMEVDAARREIRSRRQEDIPDIPGNDLILTIDSDIQFKIEEVLSAAVSKYDALSGTVIVQRVKTGEILGMVTLPSFDPQHFNRVNSKYWKNNAISRSFEPGSVMKVVTLTSALQAGLITPNSTFDVGKGGIWYYAGRPLRDHAYGIIRPAEIIAKSSNIGTAMIGLLMAEPAPKIGMPKEYQRLYYAFLAAGFGAPTGIDLPGEESGIVPHFSRWSKLSPTRMSIGQGIAVTPVQLCNAYATIANNGVRLRPHIVKEIRSSEGALIKSFEPEVMGRPYQAKYCKQMLLMMQGTTQMGGTARRAALSDYTVAGKTGTAQIPTRGGYSSTDYNATFVGIFPASAPELVIMVSLERPHLIAHTGGGVAAPIFKEIAEFVGHYLAIPADKHTEPK